MKRWLHRLWMRWRTEPGAGSSVISALLAPAAWIYRLLVTIRNRAYDHGVLRSRAGAVPSLAVGNLTVGGAGKTPIAAWLAGAVADRGRRPAIVLRGYGGDETEVHRRLNPAVPVVVGPRRVDAVRRAAGQGAEVAILDDAFQHRAIRPDVNVLLISAEEWTEEPRLLPRGPWREPPTAMARADLIVITRKTASPEDASGVALRVSTLQPDIPQARAFIGLAGISTYDGPAGRLGPVEPGRGFRCALAIAGVARPEIVWEQMRRAAIAADEYRSFPDHHRYTKREVEWIADCAKRGGVLMTLKDAVKLGPGLTGVGRIHVLRQRVAWESGVERLEELIIDLLARSERSRSRRPSGADARIESRNPGEIR